MASKAVLAVVAAAICALCCDGSNPAPLPSVDRVLNKASSKAHDFAEQALAMQKKLGEQQEHSRAVLRTQKAEYERLLQVQSNQSQAISLQITQLEESNEKSKQFNIDMAADLKKLSEKNAVLRASLRNLTTKVATAHLFLEDSLKVTDDSDAKELDIIAPATEAPTLDHFLEITSRDSMALLARGDDRPEDIVSMLSDSLDQIAEAEKEGAEELRAHFLESFRAAEERQAALNETWAALLQTQASLRDERAKLHEAKVHLEATSKDLFARLRAIRSFATKLDASVLDTLRFIMPANASSKAAEANAALERKASNQTLASSNRSLASSNRSLVSSSHSLARSNNSLVNTNRSFAISNLSTSPSVSVANTTVTDWRHVSSLSLSETQPVFVPSVTSLPAVPEVSSLRKTTPKPVERGSWFTLR